MSFNISFIGIALVFCNTFAKTLTYPHALTSDITDVPVPECLEDHVYREDTAVILAFKDEQGLHNPIDHEDTTDIPVPEDEQGLEDLCDYEDAPGPQYSSGTLLVRHSQSQEIPRCDAGHFELWNGYSLLNFDGNSFPHDQDLGSSGSCVRQFSTLPVMSCGVNNVCNYAARNDRTFWLFTSAPIETTPVKNDEMSQYISRCVVCEAPTNVIVEHSQSLMIPECPFGWENLWNGYSFLMHTAGGHGGGGQDLSSTGSCLKHFRAAPFIECNGGDNCEYYQTMASFWMVTVEENQQFIGPKQQTLAADNIMHRVSRCSVCIRKSQ